MANINNLTISYPDFQLNTTIDPEQFDTNNLEIVTKVNEIIAQENTNTNKIITQDTNIATNTTAVNNANTTANSANTKADNAVITANNASTVANSANTKADTAITTANNASTTATNANAKALAVETDYNTIKPQLTQAVIDVASKASVSYVDSVASNFVLGIMPWMPDGFKRGTGENSVIEGISTTANGDCSHAEGRGTQANGTNSHAEGENNLANGIGSHVEGEESITTGEASHAEGFGTRADSDFSHAEGYQTTSSGYTSHAEGFGTFSIGDFSHSQNNGTKAQGKSQTVIGEFNIPQGSPTTSNGGDDIFIVGNGTNDTNRSNALSLTRNGALTINEKIIMPGAISIWSDGGDSHIDATPATNGGTSGNLYIDADVINISCDMSVGLINGIVFRNNAGTLEWSTNKVTWNAVGGAGIGSFEFGLPII